MVGARHFACVWRWVGRWIDACAQAGLGILCGDFAGGGAIIQRWCAEQNDTQPRCISDVRDGGSVTRKCNIFFASLRASKPDVSHTAG